MPGTFFRCCWPFVTQDEDDDDVDEDDVDEDNDNGDDEVDEGVAPAPVEWWPFSRSTSSTKVNFFVFSATFCLISPLGIDVTLLALVDVALVAVVVVVAVVDDDAPEAAGEEEEDAVDDAVELLELVFLSTGLPGCRDGLE